MQNYRGFPFLLPFLAGAVVGPLFFNGFNYSNNCPNNNCNFQPIYPVPMYQNVYPAPIYGPQPYSPYVPEPFYPAPFYY